MKSRCYVATPFGRKTDQSGRVVDFDSLYNDALRPVLLELGFDPMRADELRGSAVIHKAQLTAIMNSEAMIADVTTYNANVLYELGLRHAVNPGLTITMCNLARTRLPYDLTPFYAFDYQMGDEQLTSEEAQALRTRLREVLLPASPQRDRFRSPLHDLFPELQVERPRSPCVFIGHGRSSQWAKVQTFLRDDMHLDTVTYESESRAGLSIVPILEDMLRRATFAVLVLTAEDDTADGTRRARQNVVHEAGLFQGKLDFPRAVMLIEKGLEEFSNVAGLQHISFEGNAIEATFYDLQRALKREGLAK